MTALVIGFVSEPAVLGTLVSRCLGSQVALASITNSTVSAVTASAYLPNPCVRAGYSPLHPSLTISYLPLVFSDLTFPTSMFPFLALLLFNSALLCYEQPFCGERAFLATGISSDRHCIRKACGLYECVRALPNIMVD